MLASYHGYLRRTSFIFALIALSFIAADNSRNFVAATSTARAAAGASNLFSQYRKIAASDGADLDRFGEVVSLSGKTAVIGASYDDARRGAAYVFERNRTGGDNWGEVKKLGSLDGAAGDLFGYAVAMSVDTIVIGAPADDANRGSVYVFERNAGGGENWGQLKKINASDATTSDKFGFSVAISGETIIVGAPTDDAGRGSVYVFNRNEGGANNWGQSKKIQASDGANDDNLGYSVAISIDTIIAGAPGDDGQRGSAYVFERNQEGPEVWPVVRKILSSDGVANDQFGGTVAIDLNTAVVSSVADNGYRGSAFVFERNKGGAHNWGEVRKIVSSDTANIQLFGEFLSISNDVIAVGTTFLDQSKGAVFLFERNRGGVDNWGSVTKLTASDRATGDAFGAVSICNDTMIIGSRASNEGMGSAYVFVTLDKDWVQERKALASDGQANERYGAAISISGKMAAIGASNGNGGRGAVYIIERNRNGADGWGEVRRLIASDGAQGDLFGAAVRIHGDTVVIGAPQDDNNRGSLYVFERNTGGADNWGQTKKIVAADGAAGDQFGIAVGLSGSTIVVGAPGKEDSKGAGYIYQRNRGGANNWGEAKKVAASNGGVNEAFGRSISISVDTVVVGSTGDDGLRGSAFIFERNKGGADNWGEVKKFGALDGLVGDAFGSAADISGDTAIVSAPSDDADKGSAYIFSRNAGGTDNWGEIRKIVASDGQAGNLFGHSVSLDSDLLVVGARNNNAARGAAYVFERNRNFADGWGQTQKLSAVDALAGDLFGTVALAGGTLLVGARGDDLGRGSTYIFSTVAEAISVSAASFQRVALAPQMIAAVFGQDLATGNESGTTIPLPTNLRGTTVGVRDSAGVERLAQLFFVSPTQVNYYVPPGTAGGPATVKVTSASGQVSFGLVEIANVSPGTFSANSDGQGVAAAQIFRIRGAQRTFEPVSTTDSGTGKQIPLAIDLGPATDEVFLVLYGTGVRFRTSESSVSIKVGVRVLQTLYAGAVDGYIGLDQINSVRLPRDLVGVGLVNVELNVDGKLANVTTVAFK